ncbi:MAG: hypothetical protein AAGA26_07195 [Pseudomonadota bacterium]
MTDLARFEGLTKMSKQPALAVLAAGKAKLQGDTELPPEASIEEALGILEQNEEYLDVFQLFAHGLPPREATWWACLAAREMFSAEAELQPKCLKAAEDWVFKPTDEARVACRDAMESAPPEDDTTLVAMAATFAKGTLGAGELDGYDAPVGAIGGCIFSMVLISMFDDDEQVDYRAQLFVERGIDIARGGNGNVEFTYVPKPEEDFIDEDDDEEDDYDDFPDDPVDETMQDNAAEGAPS